jgi:hypothetical protein
MPTATKARKLPAYKLVVALEELLDALAHMGKRETLSMNVRDAEARARALLNEPMRPRSPADA